MSAITLPRPGRGRRSANAEARHQADLAAFCAAILEIRSRLDFKVSARGWCYILEEHGLGKGDFDAAERLIVTCRKSGLLPLGICADDDARSADNLEALDHLTPKGEASWIVNSIGRRHLYYTPFSFWRDQACYVEMLVEKVDLKSLFGSICKSFNIPITNGRGWTDLNSRAALMRRFANWEAKGKQPVLLYCGDHDPVGLVISEFIRANMADLSDAIGWAPDNLTVDRFGLNADFIEAQRLSWIDSLETGSGRDLASPSHPDHRKSYVQDYLARFGARKVEANALVTRPEAGRELCRQAILRHLPEDAPERYRKALERPRETVRRMVVRLLDKREPAP